jgi:ankyrin repeat protein
MRQALELIVDWGVSLNAESDYGESALSVLSHRGLFQSVDFLLRNGADGARLGWTGLHCKAAAIDPANALKTTRDGALESMDPWERTPLHIAVMAGNLNQVDLLLRRGANPKATWRGGDNALHAAAMTNQREAIAKLLSIGLEADWLDDFSTTPLMTAVQCDSLDAASALLAGGARIDAENSVQDRPVHFAQTIPAFELLVRSGCDLNVVSGQGRWPLYEAAESGNAAHVNWLVEHGAQVDLTSTGETALHASVRSDDLATVAALLDAGASPNARDVDGWTPLFCLSSPEVARLLLDHGADPATADDCGMSPCDWIEDPEILEELKLKIHDKK